MLLPALTIFLGAFLLFQLQPLMGKFLLPWFGGGPGVWTTCMLFFQTLLLAGYAYAHGITTKLPPRKQAVVHLGLLAGALLFLPVIPGAGWKPTGSDVPVLRILLLLAATVGLPYLALSATGPLVQRWISLGNPTASPYRLYALSNAGSLLALVSFPFVFEPHATRTALGWGWSAGFVVFAGLCGALAWRVRAWPAGRDRAGPVSGLADADPASPLSQADDLAPNATDRLMWFALPAVASLLLLAVTNKICLDIAAVPFLWVLPLAVYLLTFILCFDHPRWYSRRLWSALLVLGCGGTARCLADSTITLPVQVGVFTATLFAAGMVCHGELYRLRPAPSRLTGYYLVIALGGAAGSLFVALGGPLLFADYRELQVGLVLALYFMGVTCVLKRSRALATGSAVGALAIVLLVPALQAETSRGGATWFTSWAQETVGFFGENGPVITAGAGFLALTLRHRWRIGTGVWKLRHAGIPLLAAVLLGVLFVVQARKEGTLVLAAARNFYGAYKVLLYGEEHERSRSHLLSHGGITHGMQLTHADYLDWPTTYYGATSGVARALDSVSGARRIGLVGLGAGSLVTYGRPDDVFRFYEIDPAIVGVARDYFSYLRRTPARVEIALGDARLSMEAELRDRGPQEFDLLILDAFSGDAIPVHLLTREAMAIYRQHLKPGGLLAIHISNRHLDLRPVVESLARHHGLHFVTISDTVEKENWWLYNTTWMLLSADEKLLKAEAISQAAEEPPDETARLVDWTDDHASLFEVLK
ncbi:ferrichrome ABC transporter permease [Oleiharenicola lentus]|uniref:Ferrichrome ABC transporter permease n=1 Tax=Oleiharenicola lentus TaxID=2508720 RepID=A0A4V1M6F5_9BACT|nr:fused MFS/spermidine synthase [Oleiharenicola lentus]RXK55219.1 ferrichrome ABC transporter permease [Oleiharenicola lentus]